MPNTIREDIERLMKESRWQEALDLLNTDASNPELQDLRTKVEKQIQVSRNYIQKYIREHLNRYSKAAIFNNLVVAGYREADIREAFETLNLDMDSPEKTKKTSSNYESYETVSTNPLGFLLFFPLIPIVLYILVAIDYRLFGLVLWAYPIVFLLGTFLPRVFKERNPSLAKGMIYGFRTLLIIFVVLPIVGIVVLWGICMLTGTRL